MRRAAVWVGLTAFALAAASSASAGFSLTSSASPSFSVTLNGSDQTGAYTVPMTVDNSTTVLPPFVAMTGGWNLTVTSTTFTTGGGKTLATNASTMTGVASACAGVCTSNPSNSVTYPLGVPAGSSPPAAVKFFNAAANTGIGTFTITPTVSVAVAASAYAGSYTSTLTLTLAAGP